MVLIESKKYACETCIKGHRSSGCKHTDRPLYEIKKKGRPITQCEHCRELRKTKQVHVKCSCYKEEAPVAAGEQASGFRSAGVNKMLESAAFPNGLPEALEASVASQLLSQGATSDSEHEGCSCLSTAVECHCWTPRKIAPRARKKEPPTTEPPPSHKSTSPRSSESPNPVTSSAASNRAPELRSLLPKPPHDPSSSSAPHLVARHESKLYSPYGRAYDQFHPNHPTYHNPNIHPSRANAILPELHPRESFHPATSGPLPSTSSPSVIDGLRSSRSPYSRFGSADIQTWNSFQAVDDVDSVCGCGDSCACPHCLVHQPNVNRAGLSASTCTQPDVCRGCIGCAALTSLPHQFRQDLPPDTALSIYDGGAFSLAESNDSNAIDEWIRQMQQGSVSSIRPLSIEDQSRSVSPPSNSLQLPGDSTGFRNSSSEIMYTVGSGGQSTFAAGRSRSFDDILSSTFSNFDSNAPLDLSLFSANTVTSGDGQAYLPNATFDLGALQNVPSMSADFDLDAVVPRSRSASETSLSDESGVNRNAAFSDLGEMSSMSVFYHHSSEGGRGSVRSLPDTLGYF
ncbi:hypothetical protein GYMLUDRAFT_33079 [Collybiopsis luxurians FD-317 M1]|nr:hypothetical protein GYMLUDRAFT_33079 [Collybiopsis luxurians FD-317 M1]